MMRKVNISILNQDKNRNWPNSNIRVTTDKGICIPVTISLVIYELDQINYVVKTENPKSTLTLFSWQLFRRVEFKKKKL